MRFCDLSISRQRVFELEWASVCEDSKVIAAVIADEGGFPQGSGHAGTLLPGKYLTR